MSDQWSVLPGGPGSVLGWCEIRGCVIYKDMTRMCFSHHTNVCKHCVQEILTVVDVKTAGIIQVSTV